MISKRERELKKDSRNGGNFDLLKQRLEEAGIYHRTKQGEVIFFNSRKGYGFIRADGSDYFIHITAIEGKKAPAVGDSFNVTVGENGKVREAHRIDSKAT